MANKSFSRFRSVVFAALSTRSQDQVLPAGSRLTGLVLLPVGDASVDISVEFWDRSTLVQQSKVIPSIEGTNETALVEKWRGEAFKGSTTLEQVVELPVTLNSAMVLSVCRPSTDTAVRTIYIEVKI